MKQKSLIPMMEAVGAALLLQIADVKIRLPAQGLNGLIQQCARFAGVLLVVLLSISLRAGNGGLASLGLGAKRWQGRRRQQNRRNHDETQIFHSAGQ